MVRCLFHRAERLKDLACRITAAVGKLADLLRHNRESASRFACTCRLNGGVQCEQVRLLRDCHDEFGHLERVLRLTACILCRLCDLILHI